MLQKIKDTLSAEDIKRIARFIFISFIATCIDVIGISSIMPVIMLAIDQNAAISNKYFIIIYEYFNYQSQNELIEHIILSSICIIILSNYMRGYVAYLNIKILIQLEKSLSIRLLATYQNKDYQWYLTKHTSDLNKVIHNDAPKVINEIIGPIITLTTQLIFIISITSILIYANAVISFATFSILIFSYTISLLITKEINKKEGRNRFVFNEKRLKVLNDALAGFRDIKLARAENKFINEFSCYNEKYADAHSRAGLVHIIPRYLVEAAIFVTILSAILFLMNSNQADLKSYLPLAGLFAISAYRLMPSFYQIYSSISLIRFSEASLNVITESLKASERKCDKTANKSSYMIDSIIFNDVNYTYPNGKKVIKNLSFNINDGSYVVIKGRSGAGKSTLLDLISGLLKPTSGKIFYNKSVRTEYNDDLIQKINYISQKPFFYNKTIMGNIALAEQNKNINKEKVYEVSKIAEIHDEICCLSLGYDTKILENGKNFSGGQLQRIAIARSLYNKPNILILDESTNAIPQELESKIIRNIKEYNKNVIILHVIHRANDSLTPDLVLNI